MDRIALTQGGQSSEAISELLNALHDQDYQDVTLKAGLYTHWALGAHAMPNASFTKVAKEAVALFAYDSLFYAKSQGSLIKFQDDLLSFVASLHDAPKGAGGVVTMGGTESNMLAMKAARDRARETARHIKVPEIVMSETAHPSFSKGVEYLGFKETRVPMTEDFRADAKAIRDAITPDTIMLIASAPAYPHGIIDPVEELSEIAVEKGLWLHVDGCVGGIIAPFLREIDNSVPYFGFNLPGVMSISADFHKHGYSPEGVSTLTYRDKAMLSYQEFVFDDWPNGHHVAPVIVGSRPAGPLAGAWATAQLLGVDGYREIALCIHEIRSKLANGIAGIEGLRIFGHPNVTILSFGSDELDIFAIGEAMNEMGWNVHRTKTPRGLHLIVDPHTDADLSDVYLNDLRTATDSVRKTGTVAESDAVSY